MFKANVQSKCTAVTRYYRQASYNQLNVAIDIIGFFKMANNLDRYIDGPPEDGYPNFDTAALPQIWAESADYAMNKQGYDLNSYDVFMVIMHLNTFVRAWGAGPPIGPNIK
jgi:hypothetical protein